MVARVRRKTHQADESKIVNELQAAQRWVGRRVFNSTGGPELLTTIGEELTALAATTRSYDLGANVTGGVFLGLKQLWVKLPGSTRFSKMDHVDVTEMADSATTAAPDIASGHPISYAVINFSKLRFAPALPASSVLRVDYFRVAPLLDPASNNTTENGSDLPEVFHDAIVHKANAQIFNDLDDDREGAEETRARDAFSSAMDIATGRVQGPTRTQPFNPRRRR